MYYEDECFLYFNDIWNILRYFFFCVMKIYSESFLFVQEYGELLCGVEQVYFVVKKNSFFLGYFFMSLEVGKFQ